MTSRSKATIGWLGLACATFTLALGACQSSGDAPAGTGWSKEFAEERAAAVSDFARAVLEDGTISDGE